jgi:hypothetical protein
MMLHTHQFYIKMLIIMIKNSEEKKIVNMIWATTSAKDKELALEIGEKYGYTPKMVSEKYPGLWDGICILRWERYAALNPILFLDVTRENLSKNDDIYTRQLEYFCDLAKNEDITTQDLQELQQGYVSTQNTQSIIDSQIAKFQLEKIKTSLDSHRNCSTECKTDEINGAKDTKQISPSVER